jgi:energy-coupling factor transport system ATP-binding protein
MEILKIEDLEFTYPNAKQRAIGPISFAVNEGDFIVCCGKSGCGKTTLLRMIKKELNPYGSKSGHIYYYGRDMDSELERQTFNDIGYVQQNPDNQIVMDKVWHELAFGLENMGVANPVILKRIAEITNYFGIHTWYHKNTSDLSGGQKQLLNLAAVMVMQPKLIILDEPTSQLDPISATEFIDTIRKLNEELGLTVIISEHHLEEVFPIATKIMVLQEGNVIAYDKPRKILGILNKPKYHDLICGLPSAVRIFHGSNEDTQETTCPLTVKEGKEFLKKAIPMNSMIVNNKNQSKLKSQYESRENQNIVIELKNVWFRYEAKMPDVLEDVSIKIFENEIFTIVGGNGAGKTTLLNVIAGVNYAYNGKIIISGKNIKKYKNGSLYKKCVAYLPQNPQSVFIKQTLMEDYLELKNVLDKQKDTLVKDIQRVAKTLQIEELLNRHPYDLSGGEQQKAAFAKILLLEPKIILLDEPTKGIDAFAKREMVSILKSLRSHGITIVMVTHDIEFAAQVSDRCGLFFDKRLVAVDNTQNFFTENTYYTTVASRIARDVFPAAITCEQVNKLMKESKYEANSQ